MPIARPGFDPTINYYEILDVPYTATKAEIARAYRTLIRHAHPDRFMEDSARRKAEERAKLLNAAYNVLTRPELRREYDQLIRQRAVNDALFQRYTGNTPGQTFRPPVSRPVSSEMIRAQRRASRSAFLQFILFIAIFVAVIAIVLILGSLVVQVGQAAWS